jgi:hypothetical protein
MLSPIWEFLFGRRLSDAEVVAEVDQLVRADAEISELFRATHIERQIRELPETMRSCYRVDKRET